MNLDTVAEGVAHEKALPRCRAPLIDGDAGSLQSGAKFDDIGTFEAEVAIGIWAGPVFFNRKVQIDAARVEPYAAATADCFGLGNLSQSQQAGVKRPGRVFAALGNRDVNVREAHDFC